MNEQEGFFDKRFKSKFIVLIMAIKKLANSMDVREISMLQKLGLEEYEIKYLVSLKQNNEDAMWRMRL